MTTTEHSTATIAVVTSSFFDFEPSGDENKVAGPPGRDFADFVERQVLAKGSKRIVKPVPGEEGWTFDIDLNGIGYRIFVHWAPIGDPPADRWIIQTHICKALFRSLFGRRTTAEEVAPLVNELRRVLKGAPEIEKIEWITREEFAVMY